MKLIRSYRNFNDFELINYVNPDVSPDSVAHVILTPSSVNMSILPNLVKSGRISRIWWNLTFLIE